MDTVSEIPVLRYWKYCNIEINKKSRYGHSLCNTGIKVLKVLKH